MATIRLKNSTAQITGTLDGSGNFTFIGQAGLPEVIPAAGVTARYDIVNPVNPAWLTALDAGTATNAQVQQLLADLIRRYR